MRLKVLIFRRNVLIYIKGAHIFHWPTFSPPHSLPQVYISRAEELYRPLPARASQASGSARPLHEGPVDSGVEEPQGRRAGQTLWTVFPTLSHPWDPSGNFSGVSYHLWYCGGWTCTECHHLNHLRPWHTWETETCLQLEGLFILKIVNIMYWFIYQKRVSFLGGILPDCISTISERYSSPLTCEKSSIGVMISFCNTLLDKKHAGPRLFTLLITSCHSEHISLLLSWWVFRAQW